MKNYRVTASYLSRSIEFGIVAPDNATALVMAEDEALAIFSKAWLEKTGNETLILWSTESKITVKEIK